MFGLDKRNGQTRRIAHSWMDGNSDREIAIREQIRNYLKKQGDPTYRTIPETVDLTQHKGKYTI